MVLVFFILLITWLQNSESSPSPNRREDYGIELSDCDASDEWSNINGQTRSGDDGRARIRFRVRSHSGVSSSVDSMPSSSSESLPDVLPCEEDEQWAFLSDAKSKESSPPFRVAARDKERSSRLSARLDRLGLFGRVVATSGRLMRGAWKLLAALTRSAGRFLGTEEALLVLWVPLGLGLVWFVTVLAVEPGFFALVD